MTTSSLPVQNLIRSITRLQRSNTPLHIVTICKNTEKYISLFALTHSQDYFYILPHSSWNSIIEKRPPNVHTLNRLSPPIDYIICYDRAEQYDEAVVISQTLQIPIIIVDVCSKEMIRPQHLLEQMNNDVDLERLNRTAALYVANSKYIQESWDSNMNGISLEIPFGIDIEKFKTQDVSRSGIALDNNTAPQVGNLIAIHLNNTHAIIPTDHDGDDITVNTTKYFINTYKNITIKTLEAMAAENVVICLNTSDISAHIEHKVTGWLLNDLHDLPIALDELEQNNELRIAIGQQAKQKIIAKHSLETFQSEWTNAFHMVKSAIYHP